jgi:hypothetical protein
MLLHKTLSMLDFAMPFQTSIAGNIYALELERVISALVNEAGGKVRIPVETVMRQRGIDLSLSEDLKEMILQAIPLDKTMVITDAV